MIIFSIANIISRPDTGTEIELPVPELFAKIFSLKKFTN
jgi:hypothetical protein